MIPNKPKEGKMPIYEFRCMRCGQIFEKLFTSRNEKVDISCPYCKSDTVERVVSKTNPIVGIPEGEKTPKIVQRSCASGTSCFSIDLPGYSED